MCNINDISTDIISYIAEYDPNVLTMYICATGNLPKLPQRLVNLQFMYKVVENNLTLLTKHLLDAYSFEEEDYIWFFETAIYNEHIEMIKILLPFTINVYENPEFKEDIVWITDTLFLKQRNDIIYMMCNHGYIPTTKNMRIAIETMNTPLVQYLMTLDAFDPFGEEDSYTNLVYAIEHGMNDIVQMYTEYPNADLSEPDNEPLRTAIYARNRDAINMLMEDNDVYTWHLSCLDDYEIQQLRELLIYG